eukprot:2051869-Rhodomonas_salina.1
MPSCTKPAPVSRDAVLDPPTPERKERKGIATKLESMKTRRIAQHMLSGGNTTFGDCPCWGTWT